MYLINVREGDYIKAGMGFKGPNKFFKVTLIEWVWREQHHGSHRGRLLRGSPLLNPGVLRRVDGRWRHY